MQMRDADAGDERVNETESLIKRLDKDDDSKVLNDDKFSEIIWSEEFNWSVWIHL